MKIKLLIAILLFVVGQALAVVMPVGIPDPPFGLTQFNTMYTASTYTFTDGRGTITYPNAGNGPYTHYVDNTSGSATDTSNPYGTPTTPRLTIPKNLTARSVVEIHGTNYNWNLGSIASTSACNGTSTAPIFIRGTNPASRIVVHNLNDERMYNSHYYIVENIEFDLSTGFPLQLFHSSDHIAYRNCNIRNAPHDFSSACVNITQGSGFVSGRINQYIVFYQCTIGPNGSSDSQTFESAVQGVITNNSTDHIWLIECHFDRNAEDGLHTAIPSGNGDTPCRFVYVGNCLFENNGENDIDIKNSTDVIISGNTMHGDRVLVDTGVTTGSGQAIVINDEGMNDRIWIINNHIYDCVMGITAQNGTVEDGTKNDYIVGNLIEHLIQDPLYPANNANEGRGVDASSSGDLWVVNNTFDHFFNRGVSINNGNTNTIKNNIYSVRGDSTGSDNWVNNQVGHTVDAASNLYWPTKSALKVNYDWSIGSITADPLFVSTSDYHLQVTSPAKGTGVDSGIDAVFFGLYGLHLDKDIAGIPVSGARDIGAYQYASSAGSTFGGSGTVTFGGSGTVTFQ